MQEQAFDNVAAMFRRVRTLEEYDTAVATLYQRAPHLSADEVREAVTALLKANLRLS